MDTSVGSQLSQPRPTWFFVVLLLEIVALFILGVLGNKVADRLDISLTLLSWGVVAFIGAAFVVTVIKIRLDSPTIADLPRVELAPRKTLFVTAPRFVFCRVVTAFPVCTGIGAATYATCFSLFDRRVFELIPWLGSTNTPELISLSIGALSVFIISRIYRSSALVYTMAIGYSAGAVVTMSVMDHSMAVVESVIAWFGGLNIFSWIIKSKAVDRLIQFLTASRD